MKNEIEAMITDITTTTAEAEDYTGEDGLLYCGKCHTPKEAYFPKETAQWLGHDRHPTDCDCQRAAREKQQADEVLSQPPPLPATASRSKCRLSRSDCGWTGVSLALLPVVAGAGATRP